MDRLAFRKDEAARLNVIRKALLSLPAGLSLEHAISLLTVALEPGLSVNELADRIRCPQQSASRYASALLGRYRSLVTEIEREPLIVQQINPEDPRRRALFLNENGRDVIDRMIAGLGNR
jgi:DNA-binding MarR family transcriptional regulator